jgi:site-specific recombinase XerD
MSVTALCDLYLAEGCETKKPSTLATDRGRIERARIEGATYIFPASSGEGHFQGVEKVWRKVRMAAGFQKLRLHDLRHSFASVGLARGDALAVIGAILGHADVKTTSRYAHLADDPVRNAANEISKSVHAAFVDKSFGKVIPLGETRRKA